MKWGYRKLTSNGAAKVCAKRVPERWPATCCLHSSFLGAKGACRKLKEGQIISKNAKSQAKLAHGIQLVIARNFIENLREEVRKGMRQKAEEGVYPSRPPIGYRNNTLLHTIEVDPNKSPIAIRFFELYATGEYSLAKLRKIIAAEFGIRPAKSYLERMLKNPFFTGWFYWEGKLLQRHAHATGWPRAF